MEERSSSVFHSKRPARRFLSLLVASCGLAATGVAIYLINENLRAKNEERFREQIFQVERTINARIEAYVGLLRGGAGLFAADDEVSLGEFRGFHQRLHIPRHYPGIQGFGFTVRTRSGQTNEIIERFTRLGVENIQLWPEGPREEYHTIVYLEPLDERNRRAIGYDMYTESVRRKAMSFARDTGQATLSGKVRLVQEGGLDHPGFLLYVPVYSGGGIPSGLQERRDSLQGFVYAPFRAGDFFDAVLKGQFAEGLRITIWDGTNTSPAELLYTTGDIHEESAPRYRSVEVARHEWTIGYQADRRFLFYPLAQVVLVPLFGLLATAMLAYMARNEARAREKLAENEEIYRATLETAADGIVVIDEKSQIVTANPAASSIFGYSREELVGSKLSMLIPERLRQRHDEGMKRFVATRKRTISWAGLEMPGLHKSGREFPLELTFGSTLLHGRYLFTGLVRDLTARKEAEKRLRETEERFALIVRLAEEYAITTMGPGGDVTTWNPGAERIFGYTDMEAMGRDYGIFFTPEDREQGVPEQLLRQAGQEREVVEERWQLRRDGTRFWTTGALICLRTPEGNVAGYARILRDITERRKEEERTRELNQELERRVMARTAALQESTQNMEAFAYTVAHDLRAPLRAMQGFAQALREDNWEVLDDLGRDYLARIMVSSEKMDELIQDLLSYSQLSRSELSFEPVHLLAVVSAAISHHRVEIETSRAAIRVEVPEVTLQAHAATLQHAIANLVGNALKFVRPGEMPAIEIEGGLVDGMFRLSVRDNGIGIAPEHQDRIFRVFERLHSGAEYPGTGIGLAIVRKGIERMGGRVGLESALGQGSTFWIELPTRRSSPPEADHKKLPAALSPG